MHPKLVEITGRSMHHGQRSAHLALPHLLHLPRVVEDWFVLKCEAWVEGGGNTIEGEPDL